MRAIELLLCVVVAVAFAAGTVRAEYRPSPHKPLAPGAIAVTKAGNLDKPGATYQLMNDVTSDRTALFLGRDVTLDLNGYTVAYAAGEYEHLANGDFEADFKDWDKSNAPGAKIVAVGGNWPFVGKKVCLLPKGQQLVSAYVNLPLAERSYYAMVGMLTDTAPVSISVEDEDGQAVTYEHRVGAKTYKTCPTVASSKLDGGCVYAHFRGRPAGKYRVRVKATKEDIHIDRVDIRPALDAGIAIVDSGWAYSQYNQVAWGGHIPIVRDYLAPGSYNKLLPTVANAKGNKKTVIRNGVVRNGFDGIHTWGIVCKVEGGVVELDNLKMVAAGINTNQVLFCRNRGTLRNCRFETDTPFIIERHNLTNCPVTLSSAGGSEVSHCEFIGGQGNLFVRGSGAKIHDNLFVNRQRVTNHYAIGVGGASNIEICNNRFEPDIGCGITVFRSKDCDIHHNTIHVNASDRSCKIYRGAGTITGVRITDYNAKKGAERGCWGNKVHHNTFLVTGKGTGRACAIFYSSGAGKNYVNDNEIVVKHKDPDSTAMACAFYVGAADRGGVFTGNRITSNVPAFRIAAGYGPAGDMVIGGNTFIKGPNPAKDYQPIRMGYWKLVADNVEFRSNACEGSDFGIEWGNTDTGDAKHKYSVYWTLEVRAPAGTEVVVTDKDGKEAFKGKTGPDGKVSTELLEYSATVRKTPKQYETDKESRSPYTVKAGRHEQTVKLEKNTVVTVPPAGGATP